MRPLRAWCLRLAGLFHKGRRDDELAEELENHLQMHIEDNLRSGMPPADARRNALIKLGGVEQTKEKVRNRRGFPIVESVLQDIRFGLRMLRKSRGFTVVAVLTLALGIGANTAIFSVINGVLLNPLNYPKPEQLVALARKDPQLSESSISYPDFLDWIRGNNTFETLAAYRPSDLILTGSGQAEHLKVMQVSASFFPLLGASPIIGRNFTAQEDSRGAAPVVILSGGFWKSKFGASPKILGKAIDLSGKSYTVIGVVPDSFYFCCENTSFRLGDVYVPIGSWDDPLLYDRRMRMGTYAVGRLKEGVTLGQAQLNMDEVARSLVIAYPDADKNAGVAIASLKERMVREIQPLLLILWAAVGLVLLIGCANVANLLFLHSVARKNEFAVRAALGATKSRTVRQLLIESILLATAGGCLGLLLAMVGTQAALRILPTALPRGSEVHYDSHVLLFTLAVSFLAGALFGLAPALRVSEPHLLKALKESGRSGSGTRHYVLRALVIAEIALTVVLLVGAGLMIRTMLRLLDVNPGFDSHNLMTLGVMLPPSMENETPDEVRTSLRRLVETVAALPGVQAASLTGGASPMSNDAEVPFWLDGRPKPATAEMSLALWYFVDADYLNAMRIPLLRGRFVTAQDDAHSPRVAVIDEEFARKFFAEADPIGKHINISGFNGHKDEVLDIVGVVGHVKQWGLDEAPTSPVQIQLYTSFLQVPDELTSKIGAGLVVRTQLSGYPSSAVIKSAIENVNGDEVATDFESMDQTISDSLASRRSMTFLLGALATVALLLSCIGIYGVISYATTQRTHEIGVRVALGARRVDVLWLVLQQGANAALVGLLIGLTAAVGSTRFLKSMLFNVNSIDPATLAIVAALLVFVALTASYLPARRATKVDPMIAIRYE